MLDELGGLLKNPQVQGELGKLVSGQQGNNASGAAGAASGSGLQGMLGALPPGVLEGAISKAVQQVSPQAYQQHITPGVGGTDPLGSLSHQALMLLAGALVSHLVAKLTGRGQAAANAPAAQQQVQQAVPGLQTANPQQMSKEDVAHLANYVQQNHPDVFGQAAAEVAKQDPNILEQLLGNQALQQAVTSLGSQFLSGQGGH